MFYSTSEKLIDICSDKDHDVLREQARDLLKLVQLKNNEYESDRKVSLPLPIFSQPLWADMLSNSSLSSLNSSREELQIR